MYVKLFGSILDSSIWSEKQPTRLVWITMLAMADEAGIVHAAVPGLSRRAGVSLAECRTALEVLQSPDAESRSPEHDGRRIEAVDGGWLLLNYEKYREVRTNEQVLAARRMRAYRARLATQSHVSNKYYSDGSSVTGSVTDTSPLLEAEAEAYAKAEKTTEAKASEADASPVESLGAFYGRVLRPLLAPAGKVHRANESRDISVLKRQLSGYPRSDVELAVGELRRQADAGMLAGWIGKGEEFHLMALCAEPNGGIQTFERFLHDARKLEDAE